MSIITLAFSQDMQLPVDGAGLTITDDNGGVFTVASVAFGDSLRILRYTGTWAPNEPIDGIDLVTIAYSSAVGALISTGNVDVADFNISGTYAINSGTTVPGLMSQQPFVSFGLNQTFVAPLNNTIPEFNTVRFS